VARQAGSSDLFTSFFHVLTIDLLIGKPVVLTATAGTCAVEQAGGEEVQRQDPLRLGPREFRPPRAVPAGRWFHPGALKDPPHRRWRHSDAEPAMTAGASARTTSR
jgi:hypothetical protein